MSRKPLNIILTTLQVLFVLALFVLSRFMCTVQQYLHGEDFGDAIFLSIVGLIGVSWMKRRIEKKQAAAAPPANEELGMRN